MKYEARVLKENHNVSSVHPLKEFFILAIGLSTIAGLIFIISGWAIDWIIDRLPSGFESHFEFSTPFAQEPKLVDEGLIQLTQALSKCAGLEDDISLSIINNPTVNALALPGKQMIIFSGLTDALESEIGLAFVIAHELAHFKHRDHLRVLGRGIVFGGLAALVTGSDSSLTQLLTPVSNYHNAQHSQKREMLADKSALHTLQCHYGHTNGATELFNYLLKQNENNTTLPLNHYFSSHPETQKRMEGIKKLQSLLKNPIN